VLIDIEINSDISYSQLNSPIKILQLFLVTWPRTAHLLSKQPPNAIILGEKLQEEVAHKKDFLWNLFILLCH